MKKKKIRFRDWSLEFGVLRFAFVD